MSTVSNSRKSVGGIDSNMFYVTNDSLEQEIKLHSVVVIQSLIRRYICRCRTYHMVEDRFERIYDPRKKAYFYYDMSNDTSSWHKPKNLWHHDINRISPTYSKDKAAVMIQCQLWRLVALRKIRNIYKKTISTVLDPNSGHNYYYNPRTGFTSWELPKFMGGTLDHKNAAQILREQKDRKKSAPKKTVSLSKSAPEVRESKATWDVNSGDGGSGIPETSIVDGDPVTQNALLGADADVDGSKDADSGTESDESSSDDTEDSEERKEKRRQQRKYPRSKAQTRVDAAEDAADGSEGASRLDLSALGLSYVTSRIYDLTSLTALDLSRNRLRRLSPQIEYLTSLEELVLDHNHIARLPITIEELSRLRRLSARNNHIGTLPGQFYTLGELQELDLSWNPLRELPVEVGNLELLKRLHEWEVGIGCLFRLRALALAHCQLSRWPDQLDRLVDLTSLDLSGNSVEEVPESLQANSALTRLDISHNRIAELPEVLYHLPLKVLRVEHNRLKSFPALPSYAVSGNHLTDLAVVDLSHNELESLGPFLALFHAVTTLSASHNQIASVDAAAGAMTSLRSLDLSHNRLASLPEEMSTCSSLTEVDLSYNLFPTPPACLGQLRLLSRLRLSHCVIATITPLMFIHLGALEELSIDHNRLSALPYSLFDLPTLRTLDLSHNTLEAMVDGFSRCTTLTSLDLSYNRLKEVAAAVGQMVSLRSLDLEGNRLFGLPLELSLLPELSRIAVAKNAFTAAPLVLRNITTLRHWDLSWNPIVRNVDKFSPYDTPEEAGGSALLRDPDPRKLRQRKFLVHVEFIARETRRAWLSLGDIEAVTSLESQQPLTAEEEMFGDGEQKLKLKERRRWERELADRSRSWYDELNRCFCVEPNPQHADPSTNTSLGSGDESAAAVIGWSPFRMTGKPTRGGEEAGKGVGLRTAGQVQREEEAGLRLKLLCEGAHGIPVNELVRQDSLSSLPQRPPLSETTASAGPEDGDEDLDALRMRMAAERAGEGEGGDRDDLPDRGHVFQEVIDSFERISHDLALYMLTSDRHAAAQALHEQHRGQRMEVPGGADGLEGADSLEAAEVAKGATTATSGGSRSLSPFKLLKSTQLFSRTKATDKSKEKGRVGELVGGKTGSSALGGGPSFGSVLKSVSSKFLGSGPAGVTDQAAESMTPEQELAGTRMQILQQGLDELQDTCYSSPLQVKFFPFFGSLGSQVFSTAFQCYFGYGLSLVLRAEALTRSIRHIERTYGLLSRLDVAQRLGDDLFDLVDDVMDLHFQQHAHGQAKQQQTMAARVKKLVQAGTQEGGDDPSELSDVTSRIKAKSGQGTGAVLVDAWELAKQRRIIVHLLQCRKQVLVTANTALESANECMRMLGWDPWSRLFRGPESSVDVSAVALRDTALRFFVVRGRAQQYLGRYKHAAADYSRALRVAGQWRAAQVGLVRCLLAQGDCGKAKTVLSPMVKAMFPMAKKLNVIDVIGRDSEVGLLLMLADCANEELAKTGFDSAEQRRLFAVTAEGVLVRDEWIRPKEVVFGRKAADEKTKREEQRVKAFEARIVLDEERTALATTKMRDAVATAREMLEKHKVFLSAVTVTAREDINALTRTAAASTLPVDTVADEDAAQLGEGTLEAKSRSPRKRSTGRSSPGSRSRKKSSSTRSRSGGGEGSSREGSSRSPPRERPRGKA